MSSNTPAFPSNDPVDLAEFKGKSLSDNIISLRSEYGHHEYFLYWGFNCEEYTDGTGVLLVTCGDVFGADPHQKHTKEIGLCQEDMAFMWKQAEAHSVWSLPSTDYTLDMNDDIYHLGVSVEAERDGRLFAHRVPTGVCVRVPRLAPTKEDVSHFYEFVFAASRFVEERSGVKIPEHVSQKWHSRNSEVAVLNALDQIGRNA